MKQLITCAVLIVMGCGGPTDVYDPGPQVICEANSQQCNASVLYTCSPDGTVWNQFTCELGCNNNQCIGGSCTPNSSQCVSDTLLQICDEAGQVQFSECTNACVDGECVDILCQPGALFCEPDGKKIQICAIDGMDVTDQDYCDYGCDPATTTCKAPVCAPDETRCSPTKPNQIDICKDNRMGFQPTSVFCDEGCIEETGQCFVSNCTPGEKICGPTGVGQCDATGQFYVETEPCEWGCLYLEDEGDAVCSACLPGALICYGLEILYCENPLAGWTVTKTCDPIDSCQAGDCVSVLTLGTASMDINKLLLADALADCWLEGASKDKNKDVCRTLETTQLSDDIGKDELENWFCDSDGDGITSSDMSSPAHFEAAKEVFGCGLWDNSDLTINTINDSVHKGLNGKECIGFEPGEVLVANCESFK